MDINIYINQKKINPLYKSGIEEYIKRLTPYCRLSLICLAQNPTPADSRGTMNIAVAAYSADEAHGMYMSGPNVSSEIFADAIDKATSGGTSHINFYIGYPTDEVCHLTKLCLSTLSVSADMEALMLAEQIYRAFTILNHITYHK